MNVLVSYSTQWALPFEYYKFIYEKYNVRVEMFSSHKLYWEELILLCVLRYECIISYSTQWALPFEYYKFIYEKYNVRVEMFSSPLNCQLNDD